MSLGSWDPSTNQEHSDHQINVDEINGFIAFAQAGNWENIKDLVPTAEQAQRGQIMRLTQDTWQPLLENYTAEQLWSLIQFLVIAERELNGWHGDDKSPVIWINKRLKKSGAALTTEQVKWIKQESKNRFLPHGPIVL